MKKLDLFLVLAFTYTSQAKVPRPVGDMQQCLSHLKADRVELALAALHSLRDGAVFDEYELGAAHLLEVAHEMAAMQAGKLSTMLQQALGECIGLLNAIDLETGAVADVLIARARHIIRLALSILVMHALENISLHIPQG